MISLLPRFCVFLLCLALLPGCALFKKRSSAKQRAANEKALAEARKRPLLVGRIVLVNPTDRFVLIDAATAPAARVGATWRAYSEGALSAELRATDVRRRPWVIADIVSGEPQTGDTVMQPAEIESATAPRAEPVRPEPPAPPAKPVPFWKRWLAVKLQ
jgi:hypothetical protein